MKDYYSDYNNIKNHWNYKGRKSQELYGSEWTNELKEIIRSRDGSCVLCGIDRNKYKEYGEDLIVHHINNIKTNNSKMNLVSLCRKCHSFIHNSKELVGLPELMGM